MNITTGHGGAGNNNVTRNIARVLAGTGLLLIIPFTAMQFSSEMAWTLGDFITAAALLAGTGIAYVLLASKTKTASQRMVVGGVLGFLLLAIWAELAVGLFH